MDSTSSTLAHVKGMQATTTSFLEQLQHLQQQLEAQHLFEASLGMPFLQSLMIFALAVFVGYYVVWRVTPALHAPLMSVTNAISSVIIVGALLACGATEAEGFSRWLGFLGVVLASINIFGGFFITHRMLSMFKGKNNKSTFKETLDAA